MKKIMLLAVLTTAVFASQAQIRFGAQAGAIFSKISLESDGEEEDLDSRVGMTLGVVVDVPISSNFVFQPGLNFVQKGGKLEESGGGVTSKLAITYGYIEVPLTFLYQSSSDGAGGFFGGLGPCISYGMGGKVKTKISGGGLDEEDEEDLEFGSDDDQLKALELSGNVVAGYQLANGLYIAANYNMGFSNLYNADADNNSWKNSYFGIRLGFKFGGGGEARKK